MNNSKFYKRIWFKMVLSVLLFLVFAGLYSYIIYSPYKKPFTTDHDYTLVFAGASVFTRGIDPQIIDAKTGENSYILASKGAPLSGRYEMLKSALDNEQIRTVVIEASYYTLIKHKEEYSLEERLLYFPKVMGAGHKIQTALTRFSFQEDEYDQLYAQMLHEGFQVWSDYVLPSDYDTYLAHKGFDPYKARDQRIALEDAPDLYNSWQLDVDFPPDIIEELEQLIRLSQEKGCRVILLTMPMSQSFIWENSGLDTFRTVMNEVAQKYEVPYFDFNLLEHISSYLDDGTSYHDKEHLSKEGAEAMSPVIADVLLSCLNGTEPPCRFYKSYGEAKEHSVYQASAW